MGFYKQNSLQSKFDQASRISKSVFVSNFPKGFTPKDLWKVCNDYGTVMDVFITNKKSKAGKRFAFVRFIKISSTSALVLDDSCVVERDLSKYAMGKVKDVNSIPNLRNLLMDEGFFDVKLKYLGTIFGDNSSSPNNNSDEMGKQHSEDPFKIYDILKKQTGGEMHEVSSSLSHPPGFTQEVSEIRKENDQGAEEFPSLVNANVMNNSQKVYQEINRESVDPNVIKKGGFVLGVLEDMIRVGQAMGYTMDGCVKDFERIIGTQRADDQASCKRVLWEYVSTLIGRWNGETIILGDFNEVRSIDERRSLCFNPSSARVFDHFISSSGLVDVKLEGYAFTWSHPSGSKMSKLDRFLVSEGIFLIFPSITALCLDRSLSDHRPILLREVYSDFGPISFRFYHSWFSLEGFDAMVEQTWHSFSYSDVNRMIRFKKKLQDLKAIIRCWVKDKKMHSSGEKNSIKNELSDIDKEMEAKDSFQKSKIKWAIEGDENSKFFHGIINKKRSQLAIRGVFDNGLWCIDPGKSDMQVVDLERNVSLDEIRLAV
uniref:RNA-directed DNA polymerase, eukaryota n=1 Tax=Tanacetum cinerariifolium TaxID=118510 RepID=A0A699JHB7_TANCI|nr:RNA-directed DNA polymerase, eukaryota [Tanacetum cinerariifolium]